MPHLQVKIYNGFEYRRCAAILSKYFWNRTEEDLPEFPCSIDVIMADAILGHKIWFGNQQISETLDKKSWVSCNFEQLEWCYKRVMNTDASGNYIQPSN